MFDPISHERAKKGCSMLILLALAGTYAGWRAVRAAWMSLRNLPRSNDDLVFW
jgi:hypothetical protein